MAWRLPLALGLLIRLAMVAYPVNAQEGTVDPDGEGATIHVVQEGETLDAIALQYGASVEAIREANSLSGFDDIAIGQRLVIPAAGSPLGGGPGRMVTAGLGDTILTVATREGAQATQMAALNRVVNPLALNAGQTLLVPGASEMPATQLVRLKAGESLWQMALRNNVNLFALTALNGLLSPLAVPEGWLLRLPGPAETTTLLGAPWVSVFLHPLPLEQGRTGGLRVETSQPGTLRISFLGQDWEAMTGGTQHEALLAVDRWTAPGLYPITLTFEDAAGVSRTFTQQVVVADGGYAREQVRLPEDVAAVLSQPEAVQEEFLYIQQMMTGFRPERQWSDRFLIPSPGVLTSGFGTLRAYNDGGFNSYHTGADLASPVGTPIYAPADGVVVDTGLLDVRGYTTIIDHGLGVYTGYWHQSAIMVEPGEDVQAGQQIGLVGSTGLSTASHLHWELWVGGVRVDAMQWVRETLP